jgi:glutamyl-tRNA reductase
VPAIKEIRSSIEGLRELEMLRHRAWLEGLPAEERARVEELTRGMVNKILHRVLAELRRGGNGAGDRFYAAEIARRLLCGDLDAEAASDDDAEDEDL